jgi:hypothetical protein
LGLGFGDGAISSPSLSSASSSDDAGVGSLFFWGCFLGAEAAKTSFVFFFGLGSSLSASLSFFCLRLAPLVGAWVLGAPFSNALPATTFCCCQQQMLTQLPQKMYPQMDTAHHSFPITPPAAHDLNEVSDLLMLDDTWVCQGRVAEAPGPETAPPFTEEVLASKSPAESPANLVAGENAASAMWQVDLARNSTDPAPPPTTDSSSAQYLRGSVSPWLIAGGIAGAGFVVVMTTLLLNKRRSTS